MRLASRDGNRFRDIQWFRLFRLTKRIYQRVRYRPGAAKVVLFIVGCQRSGTSLFSHILRRDWNCITYDEKSPLSARDKEKRLRLDPLPAVKQRLERDRAPLVTCKPLVESQNLDRLLAAFPNGKAVWMFRDYRGVALSNVRHFGPENALRDLAPMVDEAATSWRNERLDPEVRETIRALAAPDTSPHDAAVLFWLARNSLLFSQNLAADPRVLLVDYRRLLATPGEEMTRVYRFFDLPYPGDRIVQDVTAPTTGEQALDLDPAVEEQCQQMLSRLEAAADRLRA
jgi:hypothetical protein